MTKRPVLPHGVVVALALAVLLNYVDRANLSTAVPLVQDELALSSSAIGLLLSSFFWVYMPAQLLGGGWCTGSTYAPFWLQGSCYGLVQQS